GPPPPVVPVPPVVVGPDVVGGAIVVVPLLAAGLLSKTLERRSSTAPTAKMIRPISARGAQRGRIGVWSMTPSTVWGSPPSGWAVIVNWWLLPGAIHFHFLGLTITPVSAVAAGTALSPSDLNLNRSAPLRSLPERTARAGAFPSFVSVTRCRAV